MKAFFVDLNLFHYDLNYKIRRHIACFLTLSFEMLFLPLNYHFGALQHTVGDGHGIGGTINFKIHIRASAKKFKKVLLY